MCRVLTPHKLPARFQWSGQRDHDLEQGVLKASARALLNLWGVKTPPMPVTCGDEPAARSGMIVVPFRLRI